MTGSAFFATLSSARLPEDRMSVPHSHTNVEIAARVPRRMSVAFIVASPSVVNQSKPLMEKDGGVSMMTRTIVPKIRLNRGKNRKFAAKTTEKATRKHTEFSGRALF